MLYFTTLKYKNFLSSGNAFTELQLNEHPSTLVVGSNGAGKSTMLDAICFALFGKPFRNVNKAQLINSINKKGAVVEIEFEIGKKHYKIIRGIKPNIFEIWIDGVLIDQSAAMKDYQEHLETNILKLNFKSFTQIVILGAASFIPFMQLPASSRREIIEDILDIKVFSTMRELLNKRLAILKVDLDTLDNDLKIVIHKSKIQDSYIKTLENDQTIRVNELNARIEEESSFVQAQRLKLSEVSEYKDLLDSQIAVEKQKITESSAPEKLRIEQEIEEEKTKQQKKIDHINERLETVLDAEQKEYTESSDRLYIPLRALDDEIQQLKVNQATQKAEIQMMNTEEQKITKDIEFYSEHDSCSTCKQEIHVDFKEETLIELNSSLVELQKVRKLARKSIEDMEKRKTILETKKIDEQKKLQEWREKTEENKRNLRDVATKETEVILLASSNIITALNKKIADIQENITKQIAYLVQQHQKDLDAMVDSISTYKAEIATKNSNIQALTKERESLSTKQGNIDEERTKLKVLAKEAKAIGNRRASRNEDKQYMDIASSLLKDSGIKTKVIDKYLPAINQLVNKYLKAMDFFAQFELDGEFKEVIKSRHRDEFSYESFSEGEKQRIDLALVFTWRNIAKMKNSTNTNLLILDEVFDSSLDVNGTEYLTGLLNNLGEHQNTWIISHKKDSLADKFSKTIQFTKNNNFSVMESV